MQCPKCQWVNDENAEFCGMCYAPFAAKPGPQVSPPPPAPTNSLLPVPEVTITHNQWIINGSFAIEEERMVFFVNKYRKVEQQAATNIGFAAGGILGGLIGAALDSTAQGHGDAMPAQLYFERMTAKMQDGYKALLDIAASSHFFTIRKSDIKAVKFAFTGPLEVNTQFFSLSITNGMMGIKPKDKIKEFLSLKNYPLG